MFDEFDLIEIELCAIECAHLTQDPRAYDDAQYLRDALDDVQVIPCDLIYC